MGQQAHFDPPILEPDMDVEVAHIVPDAQSSPNKVVGDNCQTHDVVIDPPHEIPLTQNHLRHIPNNVDVPPIAAQVHCGDGFYGSNSVKIMNHLEPYEMARALDSDDDRPIGELTEGDIEMLRMTQFQVSWEPYDGEGALLFQLSNMCGCDDDFYRMRVVDHFVDVIKMKHGKDVSQDRAALRKLGVACERAKKALSSQDHVQVSIESLLGGGMDFSESLSRRAFEKLGGDLFWRAIALVDSAMADSELERSEIDEVILVGGSTMIPKIQRLVRDYFYGKEPNIRVKPDEAVALGAAVKIHSLKYRRFESLDLL
ncbi:heat shock 70 kDa protein BIP2-like [Miscanthus floridulus]|uniref:heat shock 70 kDa protein BIP2-like n=1 Tax=Miscanthus floridulus TaxID=154761 RepID=UPI00345AC5A9